MKRPVRKIIVSIGLMLAVISTQVILPLQASADNPVLNWDNPNQDGTNPPFKLNFGNVTPQLLTSVVSCTGIENKIAAKLIALNDQIQQELDKVVKKAEDAIKKLVVSKAKRLAQEQVLEQARKAALAAKAAVAAAASSTVAGTGSPGAGQIIIDAVTDVPHPSTVKTQQSPEEVQQIKDSEQAKIDAAAKIEKAERTKTCINGIAIRLARNQLTSMTKYTMNWINSGFHGDPFFVRNIDSFMDDITKNIVKKEVYLFGDPANASRYPFGRDFARGQINSYNVKNNFNKAMQSDLTQYLSPGATTDSFATDFSQGGWDAWLGLTMHPQNNPLGFNMMESQHLADAQNSAVAKQDAELAQNNGYLSDKRCVLWQDVDATDRPIYNEDGTEATSTKGTPTDICLKWQTVTPGSTIKGKVDTQINTPERQLELVRTIDDALNSLFASLLGLFESHGLSSLGTHESGPLSLPSDWGVSNYVDANGNITTGTGGGVVTSGADAFFDLNKDLGNTYTTAVSDGSWNASTNTPVLSSSTGLRNHYYTVSVGGSTKITPTSHQWKVGEEAFFDGNSWRVGVPPYVIDKKGVLQMQYDYLKASKQSIVILPQVLTSVGKLDYCIPGPNPDWQDNSASVRDDFIANQTTADDISYWTDAADNLFNEYDRKTKALYGDASPMQTSGNASYLAMAHAGLNITKDMKTYDDNITTAKADYNDSVDTTNANIAKLSDIKDRMNVIIAAAQRRRADARAQAGLPAMKSTCLQMEKVTYLDGDVIK
jgi:hypothetical protein